MSAHRFTLAGFCRRVSAVLFLALLVHPFSSLALDLNRKIDFNIAAQPLASAVIQFSKQADVQVIAAGQKLDGAHSKGVQGSYSIDEGLKALLSGTGFAFKVVGENTISLTFANAAGPSTATQLVAVDQAVRQEQIVVTASKREERLIDVPLSMAVVTKDEIDRRGLVGAGDYLRGIAGVNEVEGNQFSQAIVIRGMETSTRSQNFASGPMVSTYFGETPTTNSAGLAGGSNVDLKLVDIERVEVLRGPQGTAFGSSSMSGTVRTIPVAPKLDQFEGKAASGYSVTSGTGGDNYNTQAILNIPLVKDLLAIRAVGYQYQDSGFYRNRAGSNAAFQSVTAAYRAQGLAVDRENSGSYNVLGGRLAALFQLNNDVKLTLSYLSQRTRTDGVPVASSGTYEQTFFQIAPEQYVDGRTTPLYDTNIQIANAMMEYRFAWADLIASQSYTNSKSRGVYFLRQDQPLSGASHSDHRAQISEIRLTTHLDGAWNFLTGVYYEDLKDDYEEGPYYWTGDPATNPNPLLAGARFLGFNFTHRTSKQRAAFGEASWELLPQVTLTGGVRSYHYDRINQLDPSGSFLGAGSSVRNSTDASGNIFRANLSHKLNDDSLVYGGWSQGFRLGKAQPPLPSSLCDLDGNGILDGTTIGLAQTGALKSDKVDSYELGSKFSLADRRLWFDAAVFRMNWTDIPVSVISPLPPQGCGRTFVTNAGDARSQGVELQANLLITRAIRVNLGGSWVRARLSQDVPALGGIKGNKLPGAPDVTANLGVQYDLELIGHKAFVRADSIYVGPFFGDIRQSELLKSGNYVKLDVSAGVVVQNLNIDFFVRNLTNQDAFVLRDRIFPYQPELFGARLRPRTIGVQLSAKF